MRLTNKTDIVWVKVKDLQDYLFAQYNVEIGFTSDTKEDVMENDIEPSGWYGIALTDMFDGESVLFGYYGAGIIRYYQIPYYTIESAIIKFFRDEFYMEIDENYELCIDAEDWEKVS